ncbi:MAG: alpha/beta hydrolase fold domain-containing protein [Mycobacteriales bacterium]
MPPPDELADEGLARWLAEVRADTGPTFAELGAAGLREGARRRTACRPPGPQLPEVRDMVAADLAVRLYRPALRPLPLVVYLHGGGFVMGDLDTYDSTCRRLAAVADAAVLAVDYRLAPEHPGPAAVDDAVAAFAWAGDRSADLGVALGIGTALAGDSAGAAIALLAGLRLRDLGRTPSALLLAYPNADLTLSAPSVEQKGIGWNLTAAELRWFVEQWVPDAARRTDPALSPLFAELHGLPPTIIATAEHDPLRDEGDELARRLRGAGVAVEHIAHPGLVHGFLGLGHVSAAAQAASDALFGRFGSLLQRAP